MINITSRTVKTYTISLTEKDKVYMLRQVRKLIDSSNGVSVVFNINGREVFLEESELSELKAYGVKMGLEFKNISETINPESTNKTVSPSLLSGGEEVMTAPETKRKTLVFRKPIRSGQKEIFNNGIILTENINRTGEVVSYGNLVVLKKNHGIIRIEEGSLLIDPSKNFGDIMVNDVNITNSLVENAEIKNANRVLIEKSDGAVRYEIY